MTNQPPMLHRFHPAPPNTSGEWWASNPSMILQSSFRVSSDLDERETANSPLIHTLYRALQVNPRLDNFYNADPACAGAPWYDAIPLVDDVDVSVVVHGREVSYAEASDMLDADPAHALTAERILVRPRLRLPDGRQAQTDAIETDLALFPHSIGSNDAKHIRAAVVPDGLPGQAALDVATLAEIFGSTFFEYDEWAEQSYDPQRDDYRERAHTRAAHMLLNPRDAALEIIRRVARQELRHLVPAGEAVVLEFTRGSVLSAEYKH